jgi:beta-lactamase regulating signal transducer with metallopeptidase domain
MPTISLEAFEGLGGRLVGLGLVHSIWLGLLVASLVALAFQVRPEMSHTSRHRILLLALFLNAVGPVVATFVHRSFFSTAKSVQRDIPITAISGLGQRIDPVPAVNHRPTGSAFEPSGRRSPMISLISAVFSRTIAIVQRHQPAAVALWLAGTVALGGFLGLGARSVQRICRESRPAPPTIENITAKLARRARLKTPPKVMVHPRLDEPCLCGLLRPVVILPDDRLKRGHRRIIEAILAHELAHARRRDHLVNLAQRMLEVTLFFNPAVHWLSRCLRQQREYCADALAIRLTRDPLALAAALESAARLRVSSGARPALVSALGGQTVSLLPRIQELIGMMPVRPRRRFWPFITLPGAGLIAVIAATSGLSQDRPVTGSPQPPLAARQVGGISGQPPLGGAVLSNQYGAPLIAPNPGRSDRQISYEVRIIDLGTEPWRSAITNGLRLVQEDPLASAWIIEQNGLAKLLTDIARNRSTKILQAPKVTMFENAQASIFTNDSYYLSVREKAKNPDARVGLDGRESLGIHGARPPAGNKEVGSLVEVSGSIVANGFRLIANVHDASIAPGSAATRQGQTGGKSADAMTTTTIPPAIERNCRVSCNISDGASLLISLSLLERKDSADGGSARTQPQSRTAANDRLVVITPRRIVLDGQDREGVPPANKR